MRASGSLSRRQFVRAAGRGAVAAGAVLAGAPAIGAAGANGKIGLGFIGVGGRGSFHLHQFAAMPDVEIVAVADVKKEHRDRAVAFMQKQGKAIEAFEDYRKLLELEAVDAVVVATPDHWHAIPTIEACRAGKDVYVEKPLGHDIREGRAMVEAARKYNRVVQMGAQQRSGPTWIEAVGKIRGGELGAITLVRTWNCWDLKSIHADFGRPADAPAPAGLNYDAWLGPAPQRPFNPRHTDFFFYYFWTYSGGMQSAWGVHLFDVVNWALEPKILSVTTTGGQYFIHDARDMPDTAGVLIETPNMVYTYEMRHANGKDPWGGMDHGIEFYGTKGTIWINRNGYTLFPEENRSQSSFVKDVGQDEQHKRNWLECIRSRQRPSCDIELGHLSSIAGHLINISYRVGRQIKWDAAKETILGDAEAEALLGRTYREPYVLPKA